MKQAVISGNFKRRYKRSPYNSGVLIYWFTVITCILFNWLVMSRLEVVYRRFFQFWLIFSNQNYQSRFPSLHTTAHSKLLKILPRGANFFPRNAAPVRAPENAEWFTFRRNFLFWTRVRPIRIGSQTAWQAIRLDFIDNKDKMIAKDYELHGRCEFLCWLYYSR